MAELAIQGCDIVDETIADAIVTARLFLEGKATADDLDRVQQASQVIADECERQSLEAMMQLEDGEGTYQEETIASLRAGAAMSASACCIKCARLAAAHGAYEAQAAIDCVDDEEERQMLHDKARQYLAELEHGSEGH